MSTPERNHLSFNCFLTNTDFFKMAPSVVPVFDCKTSRKRNTVFIDWIIGFIIIPEPENTQQKQHHVHEAGFLSGLWLGSASGTESGSGSGVDSYVSVSVSCCSFTPFQILGCPPGASVTPIQTFTSNDVMNSYS